MLLRRIVCLLTLCSAPVWSSAEEEFVFDIAEGPFEPTRESIAEHFDYPAWFRDAKFGIYMHWGLNSVSGANGHYARHMYHQHKPEGAKLDEADRAAGRRANRSGWKVGSDDVYNFHVRKFGHPSEFGYKDFIPLFKAEKFNADELAEFYKECGARYIGVMAVHHDNFDLFDSSHQPWNSVNMGPKLDVVGAWRDACKKHGMRLAVTNHMNDGHDHVFYQGEADTTGPLKGVPYDTMDPANELLYGRRSNDPKRWKIDQPFHSRRWYLRIKEMVDKYDPDMVYLDGGLNHGEFGKQFAAHYYNQNIARRGKLEGIITVKRGHGSQPTPGFVKDVEAGAINELLDFPWQVDTTINPGWFYLGEELVPTGRHIAQVKAKNDGPKAGDEGQNVLKASEFGPDTVRLTGAQVIDNLVDLVSKNGTMMLNVGLRPDGSLPETFREELRVVGKWLKANGEAIYGTRPWNTFGEGPTVPDTSQGYNDAGIRWTAADVRFTTKGKTLYAVLLGWPGDGAEINLASLNNTAMPAPTRVTMLTTGEELTINHDREGLRVFLPNEQPGEHAFTIKIESL